MPERRPLRVRKRWLMWLLIAGLVFVGLPIAAAALARTRIVREYAGREAQAALLRELGLIAELDGVDVDTKRLTVVARGISLTHPKYGPVAAATSLTIRPSWWALLRGRLDLHAITIEGATVWLTVRDGKIQNLPILPKTKPDATDQLVLPFHWLHIVHARLIVDAEPVASGELKDIEVHVNASREDGVRVRVQAGDGFVKHEAGRDLLSRLDFVGTVTLDAIAVERFRIQTPELQVGVHNAELVLPLGQRYRGKVELSLFVPQLHRWPLGVELPTLAGQIEIKGDIAGTRHHARGSASVVLQHGSIDQYGLGERVDLNLKFDPAHVDFSGVVEVIRKGGSVALNGQLALSAGLPLQVNLDANDVGFAKLMEQLGVSPDAIVDWTLSGNIKLAGTLSPLALTGPMHMPTRDFKILRHAWHAPSPERRIMGVSTAKLVGTVLLRADGIHLQGIDVQMPNSHFTTTVLLGFDNRLRVQAEALDWSLSDCSPLLQFELGGRGGFSVEVAGTYGDPLVRGHMRAREFAFGGFVFGDLATDFELDADLMGVHFQHTDVTKNESQFALDGGFLDFRKDAFAAGGTLDLQRLSLADFYRVFHYDGDERYEPYQGDVTGKAVLKYTMDYPGDLPQGTLQVDLELAVPELDLDGYHFKDGRFTGKFRWLDPTAGYRGAELGIERLTLRKGRGTLSVSGRMRREGLLDLVVLGDAIAARDTEPLHARFAGLEGTLALTGTVKGTAAKPRADLELVGTGFVLSGRPIGDGRMYVKLTDKDDPWVVAALAWKPGAPPADAACGLAREGLARGSWPADPPLHTSEGPLPRLDQPMAWVVCGQALDGRIAVDAMIGRTQVSPIRGRIAWSEIEIDTFLPSGGRRGPFHGRVSGAVTLQGGALLQPETLAGDLLLTKIEAGQLGFELKNQGPLAVRFDRGSFDVKSARLVGSGSELTITGGGSMREGLALSVDGKVDLGLLSTLSHTVTEATGTVALGFKLTGLLDAPAVYGNAFVRDAALKVASFPEAVRGVSGKVTFSARRVLFENFSAKVAGGDVLLNGSAELSGFGVGSYALQVKADGLAIAARQGIDLKLGGVGQLAWKRGDRLPKLSGRLRLDELVYSRPIKMDRTLGEMYAPERVGAGVYDPELDVLAIDLEVEQTRPLYIRNNLVDAELRLENDKVPFRLVGTDQRFGVLGSMSVRKGTVRFRDTSFDIHEGNIRFDDETRIDPNFDVRATTDVHRATNQADWHIEIHAFGSRDKFQFALASEPYLSEDDIALLLTVGMTHAELAQVQTSDLTSTAALEALATVTGVESEVHRALPQIDDFHIASTYSERSNRTEPQLVIGKRIARNVRLHASTGIAESRDFSTGVELELNEKTSLQAVYNNQNSTTSSQIGDVGVDLKWRLEFD